MVGTLIPIGYGERRYRGAPLPLVSYVAGSVVSGAGAGAIFGTAGGALFGAGIGPAEFGVAAGLALTYSLVEARLLRLPIPQLNRQVRQRRHLGHSKPNVLALGYGIGLGAGVLTHITVATVAIVVVAVAAAGDALGGAAAMALFGFARSAPLLLVGADAAVDERSLVAATDAIFKWEPVVHLLNALALAFAGGLFLAWSINP